MAHTNTSAHEIDRTVNITKSSTGDPPPAKSAPPRKLRTLGPYATGA